MGFGRLGAGFGRLGAGGKSAGLVAPIIALLSASDNPTPQIDVQAGPGELFLVGDILNTYKNGSLVSTVTLSGTDLSGGSIDLGLGTLASGTWNIWVTQTRGALTSSASNTVTVTVSVSSTAGQSVGLLLSLTKAA